MKLFICNAFSLSMLDREAQGKLVLKRVPVPVSDPILAIRDIASGGCEVLSAVGHADTARLFSQVLGFPVAVNRCNVKLNPNTIALIGQYVGPRLPEGATQLPEGATIEWWLV